MKTFTIRALLAPFFLFTFFSVIYAGGIETSPVHLHLSSQEKVAVLRVKNTNPKPMTFQVQTYKWNQNSQKLTDKIIITPQIFTVKPDATQIVRFGFYKLEESKLQQTYRVSLKQLPFKEKDSKSNFSIKVLLDISIPLTVAPKGNEIKTFEAGLSKENGNIYFKVHNTGNVYMYFNSVTFEANGKSLKLDTHYNHVLAQQKNEWKLPSKNLPDAKKFEVNMNTSFGEFKGDFELNKDKSFHPNKFNEYI